jgi:hypothetical protein
VKNQNPERTGRDYYIDNESLSLASGLISESRIQVSVLSKTATGEDKYTYDLILAKLEVAHDAMRAGTGLYHEHCVKCGNPVTAHEVCAICRLGEKYA